METRFPISRDSGQVHINFVWYDAFRHSKKTEQCSIHFEKAAVLFNLAAVMTQQALNADRATDAGRKEAAKYFQVGKTCIRQGAARICSCTCVAATSSLHWVEDMRGSRPANSALLYFKCMGSVQDAAGLFGML